MTSDRAAPPDRMPPPRTRVRTVPAHDELHRGGETLVLLDGQVQRVSALGVLVRASARAPITVKELAEVLEREFGPPPEGDTLGTTTNAVATLISAGLLERVGEDDT